MTSQPGTPQVARPVPQRTLSKELDLENGNGIANGSAADKPKSKIIQSLEAQAESMF